MHAITGEVFVGVVKLICALLVVCSASTETFNFRERGYMCLLALIHRKSGQLKVIINIVALKKNVSEKQEK